MSILNSAPRAIQDAASSARGGFVELGVQTLKLLNTLRQEEYRFIGSALQRVGLQRRESPSRLRPVGWIAAGVVIGGSAALLLASPSGKEMRRRIGSLFGTSKSADVAATVATETSGVETNGAASVTAATDAPKPTAAMQADAINGRT